MDLQIPDDTTRDLIALTEEVDELDRRLIECGFSDSALIERAEAVTATLAGIATYIARKLKEVRA